MHECMIILVIILSLFYFILARFVLRRGDNHLGVRLGLVFGSQAIAAANNALDPSVPDLADCFGGAGVGTGAVVGACAAVGAGLGAGAGSP